MDSPAGFRDQATDRDNTQAAIEVDRRQAVAAKHATGAHAVCEGRLHLE